MERVSSAGAQRALRPGADGRDADGLGAGPSANSAQKLTACDSDRFDWLRPSGRSIFAADVTTASASSTPNRTGVLQMQVRQRDGEAAGAGDDDRRDVRARLRRQR